MRLKLPLMTVLVFVSFLLHAQSPAASPDEQLFNNYLIKVYQHPKGGYGYTISYQNTLVVQQLQNPFSDKPGGLKNKEDAFKVSKWQVAQLIATSHQKTVVSKKIPVEVARQLKVDTN